MCGKRRCSALTDAPHRAADQMCEEGFELLSQTSSFRYLLFFFILWDQQYECGAVMPRCCFKLQQAFHSSCECGCQERS